MPAVRRSRRLSRRPPTNPSDSGSYTRCCVCRCGSTSPIYTHRSNWLIGWEEYDANELEHQTEEYTPEPARFDEFPSPPSPPSSDASSGSNYGDDETGPRSSRRQSHSRKKREGHIPRPPNAFMFFRSELWSKEKIKKTVERDHRQISRIAGQVWNEMSDEARKPFIEQALVAKEEHKKKYPDYKFSPVSKGKGGKRRSREDVRAQVSRSKAIAQLLLSGLEGDNLAAVTKQMNDYGDMQDSEATSSQPKVSKARKTGKATKSRRSRRRPSPSPYPSPPPSPPSGPTLMPPSSPLTSPESSSPSLPLSPEPKDLSSPPLEAPSLPSTSYDAMAGTYPSPLNEPAPLEVCAYIVGI